MLGSSGSGSPISLAEPKVFLSSFFHWGYHSHHSLKVSLTPSPSFSSILQGISSTKFLLNLILSWHPCFLENLHMLSDVEFEDCQWVW